MTRLLGAAFLLCAAAAGAAEPAATPEEAAAAVVRAAGFWLADDFDGCLPHLADDARAMLAAVRDALRAGKALDVAAKARFGADLVKLKKEHGMIGQSMAASTLLLPLTQVNAFGGKLEVVEKKEIGPGEVALRVRWSSRGVAAEEAFVAVRQGDGWLVLMPGPGDLDVRRAEGKNEVARKAGPWGAEAVRKHDREALKDARAVQARLDDLTRQVKDGAFRDVESYVRAVVGK